MHTYPLLWAFAKKAEYHDSGNLSRIPGMMTLLDAALTVLRFLLAWRGASGAIPKWKHDSRYPSTILSLVS